MNPYEIFNVKHDYVKDDNFLKELRKKYLEWAFLCHPDKGGSEEEMKTIINAYTYIKNDCIETIDFEKYCKEKQNEKLLNYSDIYNEVYQLPKIKFDDKLEFNNIDFTIIKDSSLSMKGGYSIFNNSTISPNEPTEEDIEKFNNKIVVYEDRDNSFFNFKDEEKDELDDYTIFNNKLNLNDLHIVYHDNKESLIYQGSNIDFINYEKEKNKNLILPNKTYKDLLEEREL